ncbi:MAG: DUF1353 domain-containing protein [Candidatus Gastranaerophilales bacterium]|nr:DUF1353 domain-containing protein [Candidatus Gastranaerophilales bacterium]
MYNSFNKRPVIVVNPENKEKPFILKNDIYYLSSYFGDGQSYGIAVNKGYNWNGANIPRFLWRLVGSQYDPAFLPASMVHDWLCENKDFIIKDGAKISSDIFRDILILYGVNRLKACFMAGAVSAFQRISGGWN